MPVVVFHPDLIAQTIKQITQDALIGMLLNPGMPRELPTTKRRCPQRITRGYPLCRIEVQQLGPRLYRHRLEMSCHLRDLSELPTRICRDPGMVLSRPQTDFLVAVGNVQAGHEPVEQLPVCTQLG